MREEDGAEGWRHRHGRAREEEGEWGGGRRHEGGRAVGGRQGEEEKNTGEREGGENEKNRWYYEPAVIC